MATIRETYTIPEELVKQLNKYSTDKMIPKSRLVSKLIQQFLDKKTSK